MASPEYGGRISIPHGTVPHRDWRSDQNCLADYLQRQRGAPVDPNGGFDFLWYLQEYGELIPAGLSPFADYVLHGTAQGRDVSAEARAIRLSGAFDAVFYLKPLRSRHA